MAFRWFDVLTDILRDIKVAWRSLRGAPAYTIAVTALLAVGIGANTAVLGIIDASYLRRLPVPSPHQVIAVRSAPSQQQRTARVQPNSFPDYLRIREGTAGVADLAAYQMTMLALGDSLGGLNVWSAMVTGNYFRVLNVAAQRGRMLDDQDEELQVSGAAVVISDALWRERFGSSSEVVGSSITIQKRPFIIVGVAPAGFTGTHPEGRTDLWVTYTNASAVASSWIDVKDRSLRRVSIIGRLSSGATLGEVQTILDNVARDLARSFPDADAGLELVAVHHDNLVASEESVGALASMLLVWAMILLMHLVACSNVAMLVVARASERRHELGIRLCLGGSRGRIIRESLTESGILAFLGAAGGAVLAYWLIQLITRMQFLSAFRIGLDVRLLGIVVLFTAATAIQFGLWPAREAAREDPLQLLGGASVGRVAGRRGGAGSLILVGQVALSLALATNAVVILRTFQRQSDAPAGFDAAHVAVATVALDGRAHGKADWRSAYDMVLARVAAMPGVLGATAASGAPLYHAGGTRTVHIPSHVYAPGESRLASVQPVGPGYFAVIGASLKFGREFSVQDLGSGRANDFDLAVINQAMLARYWPGATARDVVGKSIKVVHGKPATIIGVVSDIRDVNPSSAVPRIYVPLLEGLYAPFEVLVRTKGSPAAILPLLRSTIASTVAAPAPPIATTMSEIRDEAFVAARTAGLGLAAGAAVALLLTAIGLYGLVAGWTAARKGEISVRIALGAPSAEIHRLLLGSALGLVVVGCVAGTGVAALMVHAERSGWGPSIALEPAAVAAAIGVLLLSAGVAAYVPAHRAARSDPATVLRANG